ncbi:MAG: serine hydrolase [Deltaproteobacteria bacterium]|nr:serine hydrolase [Deltaproteobacteria bacterium]
MEAGNKIEQLLMKGAQEGVYPGAVLVAAQGGEVVFFKEAGHRSLVPHTAPMQKDTIFDLASLTKPLATTLAIMKLVDQEEIRLDQPVIDLLPHGLPKEKEGVTPRLLLCHSAGFPDWKPLYLELERFGPEKRKDLLRKRLLDLPLDYRPGEEVLYSDLGFMMLEWIVEQKTGMAMDRFLDRHFYSPLSLQKTFFSGDDTLIRFGRDQFAATEDCPWRKEIVVGRVHDENAHVLGGYSGHAGLFGVAQEVYALIHLLREHYRGERGDYLSLETVRTFFTRQDIVKGSTWALGWDRPSPQGSSTGRYFSPNSVGHLGFTGASIWMDLDRDVIVVFLTNRIHPTRNNEKIKKFRPLLHDVMMEELAIKEVPKVRENA